MPNLLKWIAKFIAYSLILSLLNSLLTSCASSRQVGTISIGTVLTVDGERVLVTFPVVTGSHSDQAANWFYIPGHSYEVRDMYPDPCKDPKLEYNCATKSRY